MKNFPIFLILASSTLILNTMAIPVPEEVSSVPSTSTVTLPEVSTNVTPTVEASTSAPSTVPIFETSTINLETIPTTSERVHDLLTSAATTFVPVTLAPATTLAPMSSIKPSANVKPFPPVGPPPPTTHHISSINEDLEEAMAALKLAEKLG